MLINQSINQSDSRGLEMVNICSQQGFRWTSDVTFHDYIYKFVSTVKFAQNTFSKNGVAHMIITSYNSDPEIILANHSLSCHSVRYY